MVVWVETTCLYLALPSIFGTIQWGLHAGCCLVTSFSAPLMSFHRLSGQNFLFQPLKSFSLKCQISSLPLVLDFVQLISPQGINII